MLLPFNHADGAHSGNLPREARFVNDIDDVVDVLVGFRLLLGEAHAATRHRDDATRFEFLVDAATDAAIQFRIQKSLIDSGLLESVTERAEQFAFMTPVA